MSDEPITADKNQDEEIKTEEVDENLDEKIDGKVDENVENVNNVPVEESTPHVDGTPGSEENPALNEEQIEDAQQNVSGEEEEEEKEAEEMKNDDEVAAEEENESLEESVNESAVDKLVIKNDEEPVEDAPEIEQLDPSSTPPPPILNEINEADEGEEEEEEEELHLNNNDDETNSIIGQEDDYPPTYDRELLLQQYKEALDERSKIQSLNQQYQHKLAEYFKKKKTDERGQEIEKNVTDQEQRYLKYMSNLEELQTVESRQANSIEIQLEELKGKCEEKQGMIEEASSTFMKYKYDTAKDSINTRSGKPISQKDLEQYQQAEAKKENEVIAVRLENIKLKNRLKKREQQLKAKEELAEGLHLIDFEQLKIENQTYNEKIEERNEELLKLRKKINSTVQVLTHLKEKLQHVQGENGEQRSNLRDIEVTVAQKRDVLTRLKQARDSLRFDNTKLKHKAGLLGNKPLLRDFEDRKDESEELRYKLSELKERHLELNINLTTVRKKIDAAKTSML